MPTAFITSWDNFRNEVKQHYLPIDFSVAKVPSGPIVLHAYTAEIVRDAVAKEENFKPEQWQPIEVTKPDDEHIMMTLKFVGQSKSAMFKTVSLRWHF